MTQWTSPSPSRKPSSGAAPLGPIRNQAPGGKSRGSGAASCAAVAVGIHHVGRTEAGSGRGTLGNVHKERVEGTVAVRLARPFLLLLLDRFDRILLIGNRRPTRRVVVVLSSSLLWMVTTVCSRWMMRTGKEAEGPLRDAHILFQGC